MDRIINGKALAEHLRLHNLWLEGSADGVRADLSRANLSWADLSGANLSWADLSGAYLSGADLREVYLSRANLTRANLTKADLSEANLSWADLREVYLSRANLTRANLTKANLSWADLSWADLSRANLSWADLSGANLSEANLSEANLSWADLSGTNLTRANLPDFQICPEEDKFIGWKKVAGNFILKLQITGDRTSSLVGRKCRCSSANVLGVYEIGSKTELTNITKVASKYDPNFYYTIGGSIESSYDPDIRIECTKGIHFFITRKEAEEY